MEKPLEQELDDTLRRQMLAYGQRYDVQTGLLNHLSFRDALAGWIRAGSAGREIAVIWIDVLNLRREFALWGSKGTEALIAQVTDALRSAIDSSALLGRFSSRCFLVALEAPSFDKAERRRIQQIADALSPMRVLGSPSMVEVAAGVAFWPADADSPDDLIRFASLAASRAGYLKSPSVLAFRSSMNHHIMRDHLLEIEMHKGLDHDQFIIVYQPKLDLITGQVLGAEALIRWNHPAWSSVMPGEFIPIAERSELIRRIFEFTLRTALKDAREWARIGMPLPLITANMSWANLRREDFVDTVRAILEEIPVPSTQLELEVTESVLLDDEELFAERVAQLKAIGARIAIDDFGTRYTGFNVLKRLPLDTMKIDRCFIQGIDRSEDMRSLCQTIIAMARQLKLRTVAEGVEEPGELEALREIGCDAAQGYLLQRPVPVAEMTAFLRNWPQRMAGLGFATPSPRLRLVR